MIFSILTFITLYLSVCIKNRKGSLTAQSISCILESIYDFTINATTGAVTNFINFIRTILFINKKRFGNLVYFLILIIFEGVIIFSCIIHGQVLFLYFLHLDLLLEHFAFGNQI